MGGGGGGIVSGETLNSLLDFCPTPYPQCVLV